MHNCDRNGHIKVNFGIRRPQHSTARMLWITNFIKVFTVESNSNRSKVETRKHRIIIRTNYIFMAFDFCLLFYAFLIHTAHDIYKSIEMRSEQLQNQSSID